MVTLQGQRNDGGIVRLMLPFRPLRELTGETIMSHIAQSLTSSETLNYEVEITFTLRPAQIQPMFGSFMGNEKPHFRGDMEWFAKQKKSIVQIHPKEDPYKDECFYQFLYFGLCYLTSLYPELQFSWTQAVFHSPEKRANAYRYLVGPQRKFKLRHDGAMRIKALLQTAHPGFEPSVDFHTLAMVERLFEVRIILFEYNRSFRSWYPPRHKLPYENDTPYKIFGIISGKSPKLHIDLVKSPTGIVGGRKRDRFCVFCLSFYHAQSSCSSLTCKSVKNSRCLYCHACEGICSTCHSYGCIPDPDYCERCTECNRMYNCESCKTRHHQVCSPKTKSICDKCQGASHGRLACDLTRCAFCSEVIPKIELLVHRCYLRSRDMREVKEKYWAYDIETCLDKNKQHVVYLITAWPLYTPSHVEDLISKYPHAYVPGELNPVFIFWGLEGSMQFFDLVCEPSLEHTDFFAHNAARYDGIFIEYHMYTQKKMVADKIQRGLAVLQLKYPTLKITFKDSIQFLPTALRNLTADFGLSEWKKGYFPHRIMTLDYFLQAQNSGFLVPKPPRESFYFDVSPGTKGESEFKDLNTFLDGFYASPDELWDLKRDSIQYCISDTLLLGQALKVYRENMMELMASIPRASPSAFDPLSYITAPSSIMSFFMSELLPPKKIGVIDRYPVLQNRAAVLFVLFHTPAVEWDTLQWDVPFGTIRMTAESAQTRYLFLGCYEDGCNKCQLPWARNKRTHCTFDQCYRYAMYKLHLLRQARDKTFRVMWSCMWEDYMQCDLFTTWYDDHVFDIHKHLPLDPRDSYKGGMSEIYKLYHQQPFDEVDFVSQYPTSLFGKSFDPFTGEMITWHMPIGLPRSLFTPPITYSFAPPRTGIAKVCILPPDSLYAPILGYNVPTLLNGSHETLYGLCRTCMEDRLTSPCTHTDLERCIWGTWTFVELDYATRTLGYTVLYITEVWEYPDSTDTLFRDFITPFMITKTCSKRKGVVGEDGVFTPQGQQVVDYIFQVTGKTLSPSDFHDHPARRTIAKLVQNSFYGKLGQRSIWPQSKTFFESDSRDLDKCTKLFTDASTDIQAAQAVTMGEDVLVLMEYTTRSPNARGDGNKNDILAAYVTAFGRIMLNRVVQAAGRRAIYTDTDSLKLTHQDTLPFQVGFRLGDLELESTMATDFVAVGRKCLAYYTSQKSLVARQKGVTLRASYVDKFSPSALLQLILRTKFALDFYSHFGNPDATQDDGQDAHHPLHKFRRIMRDEPLTTITVNQPNFRTIRRNALLSAKQSVDMLKDIRFLIYALKRIVLWDTLDQGMLETLPYGWKGEQR